MSQSHKISITRLTAFALIAAGLLSLAPFPILGPAIGWPGSLDAEPSLQLSNIARVPGAVQLGYGVYLLYSVLLLPVMALSANRLIGGHSRWLFAMVISLTALSVLARCIGILRWLTVMPELAASHSAADPAQRTDIELVFLAINSYGGGVGELLGVSLFMGLAVLLLVVGAWSVRALPGWLTGLGLLAASLLLGLMLPVIGVPVELPVAAAVTSLHVWMWVLAAWLLIPKRAAGWPETDVP